MAAVSVGIEMAHYFEDVLPLKNPPASKREIQIETCLVDSDHAQIRGQITDTRIDFEDASQEHVVHCMVLSLIVDINKRVITDAQFSLPKMAVKNLCEHLPRDASDLVGLAVGSGFSVKIKELYEGVGSCFHLYTLLQAIVPYLPQVYSWNKNFRSFDEELPLEAVPVAMNTMERYARNTCHAWSSDGGGINKDFKNNNYGPILKSIAPRLSQRWYASVSKDKSSAESASDNIITKD